MPSYERTALSEHKDKPWFDFVKLFNDCAFKPTFKPELVLLTLFKRRNKSYQMLENVDNDIMITFKK